MQVFLSQNSKIKYKPSCSIYIISTPSAELSRSNCPCSLFFLSHLKVLCLQAVYSKLIIKHWAAKQFCFWHNQTISSSPLCRLSVHPENSEQCYPHTHPAQDPYSWHKARLNMLKLGWANVSRIKDELWIFNTPFPFPHTQENGITIKIPKPLPLFELIMPVTFC